MESILSSDEYDLIERAMTGKELDPNKLHHLLFFDKFLAKDEALESIFSKFIYLNTVEFMECLFKLQDRVVFVALKLAFGDRFQLNSTTPMMRSY